MKTIPEKKYNSTSKMQEITSNGENYQQIQMSQAKLVMQCHLMILKQIGYRKLEAKMIYH